MFIHPEKFREEDLYERLRFRFTKYAEVIPSRGDQMSYLHYMTRSSSNIMQISNSIRQFGLLSGDFWGYGINKISNGENEFSNFDIDEINQTDSLNKHLYYDKFNMLIFNVKDNNFNAACFTIPVGGHTPIETVFKKINMSKFLKNEFNLVGLKAFVYIHFHDLAHPISFQVDSFIDAHKFASYYIKNLEVLGEQALKSLNPNRNPEFETVEHREFKKEAGDKLDLIINKLGELDDFQKASSQVIFEEIEDLRRLMDKLTPKQWQQIAKGKVADLVLSKLFENETIKFLWEQLTNANLDIKLLPST
ncbi:MAG: hypothetical protein ACKVOU_14070 [Cytophagales bacterium]